MSAVEPKYAIAARLIGQGLSRQEVATALGVRVENVGQLISYARHRGARLPLGPTGRPRGMVVQLPEAVADALGPEAARRGLSVRALAVQLLAAAASDGLVDAILDDGGELD